MPIYEYGCRECGKTVEVMHKVNDSQPKKCEHCGGRLERLISNTTFILKGSGWYATDYGKKDLGGKTAVKGRSESPGESEGSRDATQGMEGGGTGSENKGGEENSGKSAAAPAK